MPYMWIQLRAGGSHAESHQNDSLVSVKFLWTLKSEAAAKQSLADAVAHVNAALYPTEVDAPPCPTCDNAMSWSRDRRRWRCHHSHRMVVV